MDEPQHSANGPDPTEQTPAPHPEEPRALGGLPLPLAIGLMVVALAISGVIISVIAEPLYGLVFPSNPDTDPPVPDGVEEIAHHTPDDSAEYWLFRTSMPGAELVAFYEAEGGACWLAPRPDPLPAEGISYSYAQCEGQGQDDDIRTRWEVYISMGYSETEGPTIFRVYKVWR
jgi:hypothetical protein